MEQNSPSTSSSYSSVVNMERMDGVEYTYIPVVSLHHDIDLINEDSSQSNSLQNAHDSEESQNANEGENLNVNLDEGLYEELPAECLLKIDELPVSIESCLHLNQIYQQIIIECIHKIESCLAENREKQEALQEELNNAVKKKKQISGITKIERPFTVFCQPYFKDKKGYSQPLNEDAKQKKEAGEIDAYQRPPRQWTGMEQTKLIQAVKSTAMEKKLHSYMNKKELLNAKVKNSNTTKEEKKAALIKLLDLDREIEEVKKLKNIDFYGPRDTNHDWMKISTVDFEGTRTPRECELYWKNYLHPSIKKGKWSKSEDDDLKFLVSNHCPDWDLIAEKLKTRRTPQQCIERYQSELNEDILKSKWTPEEDSMLIKVIESCRVGDYVPWHQIVYYMEGRSQVQVMRRWIHNLDPNLKKGKWSEHEDMLLLAAILKFGQNWIKVKEFLPQRTDAQCRDRWMNCLSTSVNYNSWAPEEDKILIKKFSIYGPKWAKIASYLPGRTDAMVAKRYSRIILATHENNEEPGKNLEENQFIRPKSCTNIKSIQYRENLYRKFKTILDQIQKTSSNEPQETKFEKLCAEIQKIGDFSTLVKRLNEKTRKRRRVYHGRPNKILSEEDVELMEFFKYTHQKRGRPIVKVFPEETDTNYSSMVALFLQAFGSTIKRSYITSEDTSEFPLCPSLPKAEIAFIPPTCATLHAFKNLLLNRNHLLEVTRKNIPSMIMPKQNKVVGTQEFIVKQFLLDNSKRKSNFKAVFPTNEENFRLLLSRFIAIFFWPALLSTQMPSSTDEEQFKRKTKRIEPVRKRKKKKPWVAEAMRKRAKIVKELSEEAEPSNEISEEIQVLNETNEILSSVEVDCSSTPSTPGKKKRGRQVGFRPRKKATAPLEGCRRSSRIKKTEEIN